MLFVPEGRGSSGRCLSRRRADVADFLILGPLVAELPLDDLLADHDGRAVLAVQLDADVRTRVHRRRGAYQSLGAALEVQQRRAGVFELDFRVDEVRHPRLHAPHGTGKVKDEVEVVECVLDGDARAFISLAPPLVREVVLRVPVPLHVGVRCQELPEPPRVRRRLHGLDGMSQAHLQADAQPDVGLAACGDHGVGLLKRHLRRLLDKNMLPVRRCPKDVLRMVGIGREHVHDVDVGV